MADFKTIREAVEELKSKHGEVISTFREYQKLWLTGELSPAEEKKSRYALVDTYRSELTGLMNALAKDKDGYPLGREEVRQYLKKEKLLDFAKDVFSYDYEAVPHRAADAAQAVYRSFGTEEGQRALEALCAGDSPQEKAFRSAQLKKEDRRCIIDDSLTENQKKNLRDVRKWIYAEGNKTGFEILGGNGEKHRYFDSFMKQPVGVQMKAIYLVNTRHRKAQDDYGFDTINSQTDDTKITEKDFETQISQKIVKQFFTRDRLSGTSRYWDKLEESVNLITKDKEGLNRLNAFRDSEKEAYETAKIDVMHPQDLTEEQRKKDTEQRARKLLNVDKMMETRDALLEYQAGGQALVAALDKFDRCDRECRENPGNQELIEKKKKALEQIFSDAQKIKKQVEEDAKLRKLIDPDPKKLAKWKEIMGYIQDPQDLYRTASSLVKNSANIKYCIEQGGLWSPDPDKDNKQVFGLSDLFKKVYGGGYNAVGTTYDLLTGCISGVGKIAALCDNVNDFKKYGRMTGRERFEHLLNTSSNLAGGISGGATTVSTFLQKVLGWAKDAKSVHNAGMWSKFASAAASGFGFVKNTYQMIRSRIRKSYDRDLQNSLKDSENQKLRTANRMSKKMNYKKAWKYGFLSVLSAGSLGASIVALPMIGAGVGIGAISGAATFAVGNAVTKLYDKYANRRVKKVAADALLKENDAAVIRAKANAENNGRIRAIDAKLKDHRQKMNGLRERFAEHSPEMDFLNQHLADTKGMKQAVREQASVDRGYLNSASAAKKLYGAAVDEAFRYVFLVDPAKGWTAGNLKTQQQMDAAFGAAARKAAHDDRLLLLLNKDMFEAEEVKKIDPDLENEYFRIDENGRKVRKTREFIEETRKCLDYYDFLNNAGVKMKASTAKTEEKKIESLKKRQKSMAGKGLSA